MSVCFSLCSHSSKITCPNFMKCSVHAVVWSSSNDRLTMQYVMYFQFCGITPALMQSLDNHLIFWMSRISIPNKLKLYSTCILPVFLYGSECWSFTKVDACRIDALYQWCLRTLLGIKWHQFVRNEEVWRITKQRNLTAIIHSRRLSIFGHIACMDGYADARMILTAPPPQNWKRPLGCPHITWLNTVQ